MLYLSFLIRRTERTTRRVDEDGLRMFYLSFLTSRTERTTRQLSRKARG
jgi:hypothetical protein